MVATLGALAHAPRAWQLVAPAVVGRQVTPTVTKVAKKPGRPPIIPIENTGRTSYQERLSDLIGPGTYGIVYRVLQPLLVIEVSFSLFFLWKREGVVDLSDSTVA